MSTVSGSGSSETPNPIMEMILKAAEELSSRDLAAKERQIDGLLKERDDMRIENEALREMLERDEEQIHGEWGSGQREPYDWEPELAQKVCEAKTGHEEGEPQEHRWTYGNREYHRIHVRCVLCDALVRNEDVP